MARTGGGVREEEMTRQSVSKPLRILEMRSDLYFLEERKRKDFVLFCFCDLKYCIVFIFYFGALQKKWIVYN